MTTILKRATILLSVLVGVGLVAFSGIIPNNRGVATANEIPTMEASDVMYVPVAKEMEKVSDKVADVSQVTTQEPENVGDESATDQQSESEVYDDGVYYDEEVYYDEAYYDDDGNLIPYDGSGRYNANVSGAWYQGSDFRFDGTYKDESGYSFTWYPESVLPGGGLNIPGRHVNDEGYVCDGDGNLCIASDNLPPGTVVDVPFGTGVGVVYDSGSGYGNLDMYVSW